MKIENKVDQENGEHSIYIMDVESAETYNRDDCPYCVANMKFAKKKKLNVIVNIYTRDIIGVAVSKNI